MKKLICLFICTLLPSASFAFFCPNNFNQIQIGDSIDQVTKQCGPPNSQSESTKTDDNVPQQWSYYVPQHGIQGPTVNNQGSMQAVFSYDGSGKIINIMVNNVSVGSTSVCGGSVQLGDTRESVKSSCGSPMYINKQAEPTDGSGSSQTEVKITQYNYSGTPPVALIFEGGILKEKK